MCRKGQAVLQRSQADARQGPYSCKEVLGSLLAPAAVSVGIAWSCAALLLPYRSPELLQVPKPCTDPVLASRKASELQAVPFLQGSWIPSEAEAQGCVEMVTYSCSCSEAVLC